jgi:hypothetical protein
MGFRPEPKVYKLKWEPGHDLHGLEVEAESVSVDEFVRIQQLARLAQNPREDTEDSTSAFLDAFAINLNSWNLEDKHGPVPATREGIGSQKFDLMLDIILAWMDAIAGVDPTSQRDSNAGQSNQEQSLQLGSLSQSQTSSSMQT